MNSKHKNSYICMGINIFYYRKKNRMTQEQLGELTGYSRNHIQRIERAAAIPSIDALLNIAEALHINVSRLFDDRAE